MHVISIERLLSNFVLVLCTQTCDMYHASYHTPYDTYVCIRMNMIAGQSHMLALR